MPTYEYACTDCGTHVEVVQGMGAPPLETCGVCGGPLRKVFHPAGILFKGSGFYATDNRKGKAPPEPAKTETPKKDADKEKPKPKDKPKPAAKEKSA